jgi:hypothetical protein
MFWIFPPLCLDSNRSILSVQNRVVEALKFREFGRQAKGFELDLGFLQNEHEQLDLVNLTIQGVVDSS